MDGACEFAAGAVGPFGSERDFVTVRGWELVRHGRRRGLAAATDSPLQSRLRPRRVFTGGGVPAGGEPECVIREEVLGFVNLEVEAMHRVEEQVMRRTLRFPTAHAYGDARFGIRTMDGAAGGCQPSSASFTPLFTRWSSRNR